MNRDKTRIDTSTELLKSTFLSYFLCKNRLIILVYMLLNYNILTCIHLDQDYDDEIQSYASVKRLKGKLKKVPIHMRATSVNNGNTVQKGVRKIIMRNINVTDFDQVFDVLITCIFPLWSIGYILNILFSIHTYMIPISS